MARFRPAAATQAKAVLRPHRAAWLLSALLLSAILPVASGCSAVAGRSELSRTAAHSRRSSTSAASRVVGVPRSSPRSPALEAQAVARAWTASEEGFYAAALADDPTLPAYVRWLVPNGPVYQHAIAFLTSLAVEGLVGPAHWRVGNVHVLSVGHRFARLEACSWDPGSLFKASGHPAPASLGGGASYTAYRSVLLYERGRWLVWQTATATVQNLNEESPCIHFEGGS